MAGKLTERAKIDLENEIDHFGLARVLECIRDIALEKSLHIAENWQDAATAQCWMKAAHAIERAANTSADYIGRH